MSVNVIIPIKENTEVNFGRILGRQYGYGTRNPYDILDIDVESPNMVIFDRKAFGRGVDIEFFETNIAITLHTPSGTCDLELFKKLIQGLVKCGKAKEIICEDENLSIEHLDSIYELAADNLRSGFDFISTTKIPDDSPVEIIGALFPIAIDSIEQQQFCKSQTDFDAYLRSKHLLPGVNHFVTPLIFNTDGGNFWMISIKGGCHMILPSKAEPRKKDLKVDKYIALWQEHTFDFCKALRYIDTSRRFDARRCIVKFTRADLENLVKKAPNPLPNRKQS